MKTEKERMLTYTVKDIAELCGVCENSARQMVRSKGFPSIKIGRRIIIPKLAFTEWLNNASNQ